MYSVANCAELSAAGFFGGCGSEVWGEILWIEGFDLQSQEAMEGAAELGLAIAAVDERRSRHGDTARPSDNLDCFRDAAAGGYNVFRDEKALTRNYAEAAPENEHTTVFFGEDMPFAESPCQLVTDEQSAQGG